MKLLLACVTWLGMGVALGYASLQAAQGHPWLLVVGLVALVAAVGKIGCATH